MFVLKIYRNNPNCALTVCIDGCPEEGLAAVDFRRANGLPESPTNLIDLTPASVTDEAAARTLPLDAQADFDAVYLFRQAFAKPSGEVAMRYPSNHGRDNCPRISPEAIRAWMTEQTAANALALYASVQDIDRREREKGAAIIAAKAKAKEDQAAAIAAARELLKDELAEKDRCIANLERKLEEARDAITELQG